MKLYLLLLGAFILQVFVFLPPYRTTEVWYIDNSNDLHSPTNQQIRDDRALEYLDEEGVGPYIHNARYIGQADGFQGGGLVYAYYSVYLGNIAVDFMLALIVVIVKRIER
jgi:hypothetical protein